MFDRQTTLKAPLTFTGVGVHSGAPTTLTLHPSGIGTGISFRRTGSFGTKVIHARYDRVTAAELSTVLGDPADGGVATVEHLLSAFRGVGLDNVVAEMSGPEAPILDGATEVFTDGIMDAGLQTLDAPRRYIKILKPVRFERGDAWAELVPQAKGFSIDIEIDFPTPLIGRQRLQLDVNPRSYRREIAWACTFGFLSDVERLRSAGFARGSSLENSIVVDGDQVVNPTGLRSPDHFVRHKALDAIGDLALAGLPLRGRYRSYKGGHRVNVEMVKALAAQPSAWTIVEAEAPTPVPGYAELSPALVPAFAPDRV
ncbi:UDP-3-O-acyl-N-acetylglucosamine deacetylase [Agaricicola taiwanensis]|uniref:UDP-3-O-acyl-N-acetylglucosamine deacetylase n=1 Tax=Agaricicola taiwanensis TaxID=591372 RepID=A0A8J2YHA7_9RHOB|nr:UDP-3-O-acyl-N-acetylglucosamine deacetylase [Agaricicola taiwanensis]GGE42401.1 UDP-3-O-acyl-N-acetylglucosamine deacetylase [Agaricicola taiwanensis]